MKDRVKLLRSNATDAEILIWYHLRNRRLRSFKFRRQVAVGRYIVDFVCPAKRLIIEVDGGQHTASALYDQRRTEFLNRQGYRVVRYWNHDVLSRTEEVLEDLLRQLAE